MSIQEYKISKQDTLDLKFLKEVLWPKAYHTHNLDLLDSILDNDFEMIDQAGGWYNKKDEIDWVTKSDQAPDSFYYEIKRLDIYSNGTAIIAGTGHNFNDTIESTYQSSNVLINKNGRWVAVSSHVSGVK